MIPIILSLNVENVIVEQTVKLVRTRLKSHCLAWDWGP